MTAPILDPAAEVGRALRRAANSIHPSPYAEALSAISGFFQYIDPHELTDLAAQSGLTLQEERTLTLDSGKSFVLLRMKKTSRPQS